MPAYKDNERNTWFAKFQYTDWQGKTKTKVKRGFESKKDALIWERVFLADISNDSLTIGTLCKDYLLDKENRRKLTTVQNCESNIRNHILPYFADRIAAEITTDDIRSWQNRLIKQGYADSTLHVIHGAMTAVFNYGIAYKGLKKNPASEAGTMGSMDSKDQIKFWTKEQYDEFISQVKDVKYAMLFDTLYYSGMRIGECLALKKDDIDWDKRTLRIDENLVYVNAKHGYVIQTPKTKSGKRVIVMPDFYMERLKAFVSLSSGARLFNWTHDKNAVRKYMIRVIKKTNLPEITLHDLRHSHVSLLINTMPDVSILVIAQRLGHDDITTTLNTYSHLFPNKQNEIADRMDDMFRNQ